MHCFSKARDDRKLNVNATEFTPRGHSSSINSTKPSFDASKDLRESSIPNDDEFKDISYAPNIYCADNLPEYPIATIDTALMSRSMYDKKTNINNDDHDNPSRIEESREKATKAKNTISLSHGDQNKKSSGDENAKYDDKNIRLNEDAYTTFSRDQNADLEELHKRIFNGKKSNEKNEDWCCICGNINFITRKDCGSCGRPRNGQSERDDNEFRNNDHNQSKNMNGLSMKTTETIKTKQTRDRDNVDDPNPIDMHNEEEKYYSKGDNNNENIPMTQSKLNNDIDKTRLEKNENIESQQQNKKEPPNNWRNQKNGKAIKTYNTRDDQKNYENRENINKTSINSSNDQNKKEPAEIRDEQKSKRRTGADIWHYEEKKESLIALDDENKNDKETKVSEMSNDQEEKREKENTNAPKSYQNKYTNINWNNRDERKTRQYNVRNGQGAKRETVNNWKNQSRTRTMHNWDNEENNRATSDNRYESPKKQDAKNEGEVIKTRNEPTRNQQFGDKRQNNNGNEWKDYKNQQKPSRDDENNFVSKPLDNQMEKRQGKSWRDVVENNSDKQKKSFDADGSIRVSRDDNMQKITKIEQRTNGPSNDRTTPTLVKKNDSVADNALPLTTHSLLLIVMRECEELKDKVIKLEQITKDLARSIIANGKMESTE